MIDLLAVGPEGWGDEMLRGAAMTVVVAVLAYGLGLVVGTGAAAAKLSGSFILRSIAGAYTTVIRGVPELLVIYLFFFGSGGAVMWVARQFGYTGYIELDAFTIGVLAVGIISGAYSTEVIRGAFQTIPAGQIEAGRAAGMSGWLIFRRITFPQMLRLALPGLGNVWQLTLKDTALISVTALAELMRMASVAAGSTREPFIFYVTAAALYLAMTTVSQTGFQWAERRAGRSLQPVKAAGA
ncbi:MAG: ABC transporter permease subunit [Alphaproteobacteria bacterium]|jgi:octopine/nopaline transport system permease protein|nr:ABC transporter permease subunit [Alphaproteobacteria bacterium]